MTMAIAPLFLALLLVAATDGGAPLVAPVTPGPGSRPAAEPNPAAKPPDVSQLPFTPDSISQVVRAHQPEFQECYETMLAARKEKLQGRLMTHFIITGAGTVKKAQVVKTGTTLKDKDLNICVVGVLGKLTFPKPPDAKDHPVEYPLNLTAVE
jgi:hypothetical protein